MSGSGIFDDVGNWMYVSIPLVAVAKVLHTIFTDDLLKRFYLLVLNICFLFLLVCCMPTLTNVWALHRKSRAADKSVSGAYDSDLESDNEAQAIQEVRSSLLRIKLEERLRFFRSRPVYGMVAKVGIFLIIAAVVMRVSSLHFEPRRQKDCYVAALLLATFGIFLEVVVWIVADTSKLVEVKPAAYEPFQESVRIPMRVFVPKVILYLKSRALNILGILFYQLAAIFALVTVFDMPEEEIRRFKEASKLKEIHGVMIFTMTLANVYGLVMLLENFWTACDLVRRDLFITFEKNWRQNLYALDVFLPGEKVSTLEELRDAFVRKSRREQLTDEELRILRYIERPLWETKPAFVAKPDASSKLLVLTDSSMDSSLDVSLDISRMSLDRTSLTPDRSSSLTPSKFSPPLTRSRARKQ